MKDVITWGDIDMSKIVRIDLCCFVCNKINVKVKGEDLNCDFCGHGLLGFTNCTKDEVEEDE